MADLIGTLATVQTLSGAITVSSSGGSFDRYDGPYAVTPSNESQTLNTEGLLLSQNITVEPIPSNYGLVEWNGSYISIS